MTTAKDGSKVAEKSIVCGAIAEKTSGLESSRFNDLRGSQPEHLSADDYVKAPLHHEFAQIFDGVRVQEITGRAETALKSCRTLWRNSIRFTFLIIVGEGWRVAPSSPKSFIRAGEQFEMQSMSGVTRRAVLLGLPVGLASCATSGGPQALHMYAAEPGGRFRVAAVDLAQINPKFYRQEVYYPTSEPPGTIVVEPCNHFLYHVEAGGRATRYGVGVGRQGFAWSGVAEVRRKAEWPRWVPPVEMTKRDHEAAKYADGMAGGPDNPLGARALYLYQGDHDTLYRIHGTSEPWSIGQSMSSGCIRLLNQDIIHLYKRVPIGTKVVVLKCSKPEITRQLENVARQAVDFAGHGIGL